MNKKILVTGGSGLVGKALHRIMPNAIYLSSKDGDLRDQQTVRSMMQSIKPDVVIHLSAKVGGIQSNKDHQAQYFDDNVLMNTLVLQEAYKAGVSRFYAMLSTCVYPDVASKYPMTEDLLHESVPQITNFSYGYAKRMMAVQIDSYNKEYGTKYCYLIPSNLYGIDDKYDPSHSHFVAALIAKIYEAKKNGADKIQLFGTGSPRRQFIIADDLAQVVKRCIDNDVTESFNVASFDNPSIRDIANVALSACDATHLQLEFDTAKPDGQINKQADVSKMMALFPDIKLTSLEDGIRIAYDAYAKKQLQLTKTC